MSSGDYSTAENWNSRNRLVIAHDGIVAVGANKASFLAIVSTFVGMLGNAARKNKRTPNCSGINEAIEVNPLPAIL